MIHNLIDQLGFVVLLFGFALALALIIGALPWAVEAVLRHRIGVYLGHAVMFVVAFIIVINALGEIMNCGLLKSGYVQGVCEFSPIVQYLCIVFMFITMPLVFVSQMKLKKWSQSRFMSNGSRR